jgi:hypothetical protein
MKARNGFKSGFLVILLTAGLMSIGVGGTAALAGASKGSPFLSTLGAPRQVASTVPANGDVNPYGIVVVPTTVGTLVKGDTLISNFNDKANVQGTGQTIVEVSPTGVLTTFTTIGSSPASSTCPGVIGLTTALSILPGGWVVVGSLPAGVNGALPLVNPAGCLLVLNSSGTVVETWTNQNINGPWDMTETATKSGVDLFVSNVLTRPMGTTVTPKGGDLSTIVRISVTIDAGQMPQMSGLTVIGTGFLSKANKAAFVQGPTGVALGRNGDLYVAGTVRNHISVIPKALSRMTAVADGAITLSSGGWLNGPLGLTIAPNGDVLAMNANNGVAVEISPSGHQVAKKTLVPNGSGDLFGVTISPNRKELLFVNDASTANALDVASVK